MADRQTKVSLSIQMQQYVDGMHKAAKATRETVNEAAKLAQQREAFTLLGRTSLAAGALIGAGLAVAVAKVADFDQAMSNVAATGQDARDNIDALRAAALEAGATTVFSATESANAIEELAKAGLDASDVLGGALTGSLDLAAAGGLGVARAAEIASTTLNQFKLGGEDASHVADLLAAGAGKAMGDVEDLAQALNQGGLVADQFGISVEETTATLAAFASQGLLGSDAGTSFRTMLLRLAKPTEEVKDLMEEIGFEAYNAQGQFIGLAGLAGELESSLAGMTDEQKQTTLAMIFGQDAIRGATILYEEGAAGIAEWTSKVDDAGYAAETAATKLDNLKGDWEALSGAVDTALISMGESADGPLRFFVQGLTNLVDKFNEMPAAGQQAVFWVGAFGAAGATALGSYLLLVPKIAEFNAALELLGPRAQRASRAVGALSRVGAIGVTIGAAAIGVDWLANEIAEKLLPSAAEVDNKMRSAKTGVELFAAALNKEGITNTRQAGQLLRDLGGELDGVANSDFWNPRDISGTAWTVIKEIAETAKTDLPEASAQFRQLAEDGNLTEKQLRTMIKTVPELRDVLLTYADTSNGAADAQDLLNIIMGEGAESTKANEDALRALAGQAASTGDEVDDLAEQIRNFGSATISVKEAQAGLEQALDDLTDSIETNGTEFRLSEQAGRDNQAALIDLAEASKELAAATYEQSGSQEDANAIIANGRQKLIEMLAQFDITGDAAEAYADDLGLIPGNIDTLLQLSGVEAAKASIDSFIANYNGRSIKLGVSAETIVGNPSLGFPGRAGGGAITGPGGPTSDTAGLYALSTGEHVLTASDVNAMGGQHAVYAFREGLHSGGPVATTSTAQLSGPVNVNVFDVNGVYQGTIRGAAVAAATAATQGFADTFRGGVL